MDVLPAISLLLGAIGSLLAVYATLRGSSDTKQTSQLTLAWEMQDKHLDTISKDNEDLQARLREAEKKLIDLQAQLSECRESRRQLQIQIELLKMRFTDG